MLLLGLGAASCAHPQRAQHRTVQLAASRASAQAEYRLAGDYARGRGKPRSYAKAAELLRKSAEQGYVYAQTDLGSYYARGLGVRKDYSQALKWYRKAAAQGDSLAEYCIGYAYAHGYGVPKDFQAAVSWWRKSAEHGQADAQNALGQFYFHGETPGDRKHVNYAKSARWLLQASEQGCVAAMNNLAFLYQNGWGVKKDLRKAIKWYRRAAESGDAMAQANLGLMYQDGSGMAPDMVRAYKWFTLSAAQGNVVGRHSFNDYNEHHRLNSQQLAEARRMVAEFRVQTHSNGPALAPRFQRKSSP